MYVYRNGILLCQLDNDSNRIKGSYDGTDTCLDWYSNNGNPENERDWKEIDTMWYTTSQYMNTWSKNNNNNNQENVSKQDISDYEQFLLRTESLTVIKNNNTGLGDLVKQEKELLINDFEDCLDNVSKDFRNIF